MEKKNTLLLNFDVVNITGVKVNYLYVCERKLWLFDRGISMEQTYDKVLLGKLLGEQSYPRKKGREILIENLINIDIVDRESIREIKYSDKLKEADRIQVLYYLYFLKQLGIEKRGIINYPKIKKREEVILTPEKEEEVESALKRINEILLMPKPPKLIKKSYCTKCAYFQFCWG